MTLKVRIPLNLLRPFTVSLPLTHYINAPVPNGLALVKRLIITDKLPLGWIESTSHGPCITLFKVQCTPEHPEATIKFSLVINGTSTWTLTIGSIPVLPSTIPAVPSKLLHCQQLVSLLQTLDNSSLCVGNSEEKYVMILIENHHGKLYDQTGRYFSIIGSTQYTVNTVIVRHLI